MLLRRCATCPAGPLSPQGAGGSVAETATARFQPEGAVQVQVHAILSQNNLNIRVCHGGEETQEEKARHFHTYLHGGEETDEARNQSRVLGTWVSFFREA